jgi:hypothetical protein
MPCSSPDLARWSAALHGADGFSESDAVTVIDHDHLAMRDEPVVYQYIQRVARRTIEFDD